MCLGLLNEPIHLKCEHLYCEKCFKFLDQKNSLDVDQIENFYSKSKKEIEKKNENSFKCVVCNSENEQNEKNEKNEKSEKIKKEIEKILEEKIKIDSILCENEIEIGIKCNKIAVVICKNCDNLKLCKECNEANHPKIALKKHEIEPLTLITQSNFINFNFFLFI